MTITDWLKNAATQLNDSGCPDPQIDARWMAEDALGLTRSDLLFEGNREIDAPRLDRLNAMLARRVGGEPVQYILGRADFMGLTFRVTDAVLIPRQDTETLAEAALIDLRQRPGHPAALDLCCGSGCVGLSLASLAPHAQITLTDLSREALDVTRENMKALGVRAEVRHGDLFRAVGRDRFDLIASNPPYIPTGDIEALQREVRFEPAMALDGGADGLDIYRRIAEAAADHMNPGASIYLEVGIGQAPAVLDLVKSHLPCETAGTIRDLNGVERVVFGKMRNEE